MVRKSMADKLKQTTADQEKTNRDRFAAADTALLKDTTPVSSKPPKPVQKEPETKLVRDGFLIPENDHQLVQVVMAKMVNQGLVVSKTEVYRAALHALNGMDNGVMVDLFKQLEPVKRGRPKPKG